ncbi:hypothetical protein P8452_25629 [Trifolium repens]|nr:hypothetical protein P8452_25629 [Trifolium repens]
MFHASKLIQYQITLSSLRDAWFGDAQLEVVHAAAARDRNDNEEDRNEIGTMKKKMNAPIVLFTIPNTDHLVSAF